MDGLVLVLRELEGGGGPVSCQKSRADSARPLLCEEVLRRWTGGKRQSPERKNRGPLPCSPQPSAAVPGPGSWGVSSARCCGPEGSGPPGPYPAPGVSRPVSAVRTTALPPGPASPPSPEAAARHPGAGGPGSPGTGWLGTRTQDSAKTAVPSKTLHAGQKPQIKCTCAVGASVTDDRLVVGNGDVSPLEVPTWKVWWEGTRELGGEPS